jgi:Ca2+-binding RTX toxin-like protein
VSFVAGDVVQEASNGGNDSLVTCVSQTIPSNVETMFLAAGAGAINGTGGNGIDTIIGNAFDNIIDGGANLDVLVRTRLCSRLARWPATSSRTSPAARTT